MVVAVIGAGAWGSALASVLSKNHKVIQYSRRKDLLPVSKNIYITNNLSDVRAAKHILLVLPAQQIRGFLKQLTDYVSDECKIIICSKGLELETGMLLSEVVEEAFPKNKIAVLSGPNFAKEIQSGLPATSSLAAKDQAITDQIIMDLNFENIKLIPTDEVIAVQIFGALKNVLAILCGFAQGLSLGENARAALITKGIQEITMLSEEYSKKEVIIENPGCIGDIILTCTSETSRNTKFGMNFAKKYDRNNIDNAENHSTVEGMFTAQALDKLKLDNFPLLKFSSQLMLGKFDKNPSVAENFKNILFS